jgi:dephospho-CoA kinase
MLIGLTGGIGSGKSAIAKQLREMGYAVHDTDCEAKRLIVEDAIVRQQMEDVFGKEVYADGVYQTALVAQRVFADRWLLDQLNAIVHPAVKRDLMRWASEREGELQFVECAILYQAGFDSLCDKVVTVTAPEDVRLERVIARDHSTIDEVRARMRAQEIEKDLQRADLVVNNDGKTEIMVICLQIQDFFRNFAG